ncbi:MMPL family transporter [Zunongwangia sp. SCSIO 43204]|uniref:MMPL family transporter n=1 Tax=Zunongwangia sp. SCSIO 43204 TaxID=2779359 RepID=UPI001CA9FD19|nr:MMPL family transporter [Zunongwangia sp. SCSIO 43204]UAB83487.1 MMPL family transporter [Zunongwangia sp. SCSIO 43204]
MHHFFLKSYRFFQQNKLPGILLLLVFVAGVGFLASKVELEEDVTGLIPSGKDQDVLKRILKETEFSDKIVVTISSEEEQPQELISYAERFIDSVNTKLPNFVENIEGKIADEGVREIYNFVYQNLPLFLNEADYTEIEKKLSDSAISKQIKEDYRSIISPTGIVTKNFIFQDPLSLGPIGLEKLRELQIGDNYLLYNNYLLTKDKKHLLLFITPTLPASETNKNNQFIADLKEIQQQLNAEFNTVEGDFFGGVLYSLANANQIKKDVQITISIVISILLILLILFYRKIYVPLILFIPGIIAAVTAIAILYIFKGSISAISIGIGSILLGITLDYGLHILTHYRNNHDVFQLYKEVTRPVLMSSFTTAIAFLCLLFVNSEALNDLGMFAAISVIIAAFLALLLIPILYGKRIGETPKNTFLDRLAGVQFFKIKPLFFSVVILFVFGLFFFTKVDFNNDLSKINFQPEAIKKAEQKIQNIANSNGKTLYLVSYGNSIDQALLENSKVYQNLKSVNQKSELNSYSSIGGVVLSTQTQNQKIQQWKDFWNSKDTSGIKNKILSESAQYGFKPASFQDFYDLLDKDFKNLQLEDYQNITNLYLNDFISISEDFATVTTTVNLGELPSQEFTTAFDNLDNTLIIDRERINEGFLGNLKDDFNQLIGLSILAVFLILLISYQNLEISLLTLLPIGITWIIALGIMGALKIEFNILNIIISTFVFGLGLDYSIFITNACLKEYQTGKSELKTYQTSILISVITTLLGIGALIFAKHPALRSVSSVSIIGVFSAVLVAFVLQVWLFNVLFINRRKKALPPFRFSRIGSFIRNKIYYKQDLYYQHAVLDNYRYKPVYSEAKAEFTEKKEPYLRVSNFIEKGECVFFFYSGIGVFPIYLSYINPNSNITGYETSEAVEIARNCFRSKHENLHFSTAIDTAKTCSTFIMPDHEINDIDEIKQVINRFGKKVIVLHKTLKTQWLLDANFEITYRQSGILVFEKE